MSFSTLIERSLRRSLHLQQLYSSFLIFRIQTTRVNHDVDVIRDILEQTEIAFPASAFVKSLHQQYLNRGGLSKKQLEGLYQMAQRVNTISVGKLSTLEAIILKKPTRYKSDKPAPSPLYKKDEEHGKVIEAILEKYPQHKRVLFLKIKYENNEVLSPTEIAELERFYKLLSK